MNQENDKKQKTEKQETTNNGSQQQQNNETVQLIKAAEIIKSVKGTSQNFSVDNENAGKKKQEDSDD